MQVHTPADGESVDLSPGSSSFRVALSDAVMDAVTLRSNGDYQLGWLSGIVGPPAQVHAPRVYVLCTPRRNIRVRSDLSCNCFGLVQRHHELADVRGKAPPFSSWAWELAGWGA